MMNGDAYDVGPLAIPAIVAQWAGQRPDAIALESESGALTYAELELRVDRLSRWMRTQGVSSGARVALDLDRSIEWVVAMLAAWRCGAAYVALDPSWPAARKTAVLADTQPVLVYEGSREEHRASNASGPLSGPSLSDVAYVLYTSGSTGTPKGAVIDHANLLNYVAAASHAMRLADSRRWALSSTVAADLGYTALFGALFNGACLVIASAEQMQSGSAFCRFLREARIDALKIVPSHLEALLDTEQPSLPRKLILGGEPASAALIRRIGEVAPDCEVFNHYGPTETTVGVMIHEARKGEAAEGGLPLTRVLANNRIYVLDGELQPAPVGTVGELYIGGAQVGQGYYGQSSSQAFITDPFMPGERMYRTGDLAYRRAEGGLRLTGRADRQLKIRGFRVAPEEIETTLNAIDGVRHAVVTPRTVGDATELVAHLVLDTSRSSPPDIESIRERVGTLLPIHMQPTYWQVTTQLPRLANGKVDRVSLAKLPIESQLMTTTRAPRTAVEFVLTDCMAQLLRRESLGIDDDFFEMGGHSLLVIKLVARLRRLLKVEIPPGLVFDHRTAAALADVLQNRCTDPIELERLAELHRRLAQLSPEERAELEQRARSQAAAAKEMNPA
ncbi:amino acid adenylation domain-containing protein [Steroidobacter flavus]|uniref:Amino acid adenylation domain-containing protein n=1 Tax=Steroidobacter flavus TaxID=1842136 RepID=A0ABV8T3X1_9GAMM